MIGNKSGRLVFIAGPDENDNYVLACEHWTEVLRTTPSTDKQYQRLEFLVTAINQAKFYNVPAPLDRIWPGFLVHYNPLDGDCPVTCEHCQGKVKTRSVGVNRRLEMLARAVEALEARVRKLETGDTSGGQGD
jgi:hypothetical protein